jgi:hypothetical protein
MVDGVEWEDGEDGVVVGIFALGGILARTMSRLPSISPFSPANYI